MDVSWIQIVPPTTPVSTANVQILAKVQWTADLTPYAKQLITDQSVSVPKATKGRLQAKAVLRLGAELVKNALATSGVTKANVKILVLILALAVKMRNVAFCTTKPFVLVLPDLWVIHVPNVFLMWTNVLPTPVDPIQDVSI